MTYKLPFVITFFFIVSPAIASFNGYQYQRQLTIQASQVSTGTLTYSNFPALFQDTDVKLSTSVSGGHLSTGYDLGFYSNPSCASSFILNWDTETVNTTGTQQDNIWVRIPSISSTTNTSIYLCYGNPSVTSYLGYSTATWDSNYLAVYHLGQSLGSLNTSGIDSTVNANTALPNISTSTSLGKIDSAGTLIASATSYIDTNSTPLQNIYLPVTIEMWYYPFSINQSPSLESTLFSDQAGPNENKTVSFDGGSFLTAKIPNSSCATQFASYTGAGNPYALNTWHYFSLITSGTIASPLLSMFLDGNADQNFTPSAYPSSSCAPDSLKIGSVGSPEFSFDGIIDEFKVSNIARSHDWRVTEYNSQSFPSSFMTIGSEVGPAGISLQIKGTTRVRGKAILL